MPKRYIRMPDGSIIEDSGAPVDSSLIVSGAAADAAVVGEKFGELSEATSDAYVLYDHGFGYTTMKSATQKVSSTGGVCFGFCI